MSRPKTIDLRDLKYYFDAETQSCADAAGFGRRYAEIAAIRQLLLRVPEREFEGIVRAIRALLDDSKVGQGDADTTGHETGPTLFEKVNESRTPNSTSKISAV